MVLFDKESITQREKSKIISKRVTLISKRLIMLIVPIILFILISNYKVVAENAQVPDIEIDPPKIDISITKKDLVNVREAILYITARQADLDYVTLNSTDLYEEQNRRLWISSDSISFDKNNFNITEGRTVSVKILFSFIEKVEPGTYKGRIIVWSENGGKAEFPITIKLRLIWWIPFILVAFGVIANLVLSVNRWRFEEKKSAEIEIIKADSAIYKAEDEGRKDDRYARAVNLQTQYKADFAAEEYRAAKENAIKAKFEADMAKKHEATNENSLANMLRKVGPIYEQTAPRIASYDVIRGAKENNPELFDPPYEKEKPSIIIRYFWDPFKRAGSTYLALTIIIGVVMLQAWQAFFPRISDFGASSIDYITAFLYGFSGQAFLSEFADLGKRWLV